MTVVHQLQSSVQPSIAARTMWRHFHPRIGRLGVASRQLDRSISFCPCLSPLGLNLTGGEGDVSMHSVAFVALDRVMKRSNCLSRYLFFTLDVVLHIRQACPSQSLLLCCSCWLSVCVSSSLCIFISSPSLQLLVGSAGITRSFCHFSFVHYRDLSLVWLLSSVCCSNNGSTHVLTALLLGLISFIVVPSKSNTRCFTAGLASYIP